jgi:hypothetical protein
MIVGRRHFLYTHTQGKERKSKKTFFPYSTLISKNKNEKAIKSEKIKKKKIIEKDGV